MENYFFVSQTLGERDAASREFFSRAKCFSALCF